ncbi:beta-galactosidase [Flavobacterium gilvum]|nr:beta-galactosidase [Flavobacterium gilvum]
MILLLTSVFMFYGQNTKVESTVREKININREWKFKLGDDALAKAANYNDADWSNISLPHNFSIPYFQSAQWYTGYGWYRKYFDIPSSWKGKQIFIEFEAAFREAEIFVNGELVGTHQGGYTGFTFDISSKLKPGRNVLAVRLNNNWNARLAPRNGDHNFTGGIYRDVYLVVTNPVHVTWYGSAVTTPRVSKEKGVVNIKTEIKNDSQQSKNYTIKTEIVAPSGKIVAKSMSNSKIETGATVTVEQTTGAVKSPLLWHPDHPFLYKAVTTIFDGNLLLDRYETKFGFRWMKWTADKGFFLNGEHYYFKGANVHQDHAGWASAVTNAAIIRDVKMIKDCGMDFIRGSHYPHDPAFSEACDSLGVLLWEENDFWGSGGNQRESDNWFEGAGAYPVNADDQPFFEESVKTNLKEMVRIHRNHPSIIAWSMCNEPFFTGKGTIDKIRVFLKDLTKLTHELDSTRLVGIGGCQRGDIDKLGDIAGYNGDGTRLFINPGIPSVVTEYGSVIAIRPGKYDPGFGELQKEEFPWRSGQALWCAFDYGTRAGKFGKMGMIDYFRMPKNQYYWYRNEYKHIAPPEVAQSGIPSKLSLTASKKVINGTDGTDDVQLIVTVQNQDGKPINNSPDVTFEIISGPGEFPTGRTITFSNQSDIYIRDGKAAIEFRSYEGGKTVIKASSAGLKYDTIIIETQGYPIYSEGITPKTPDRPYVRYTTNVSGQPNSNINIAIQKPTRASSEMEGRTANKANDGDEASYWKAVGNEQKKWWQIDLENLYVVNKVSIALPVLGSVAIRIEISKDGQLWEKIADSILKGDGTSKKQSIDIDSKSIGRFLRINFLDSAKEISMSEVEVFGKTSN